MSDVQPSPEQQRAAQRGVGAADRELFARHAAVEAIQAQLDQAYAAYGAAARDVKWLTELLVTRVQQVRDGEWPLRHWWPIGESSPMCDAGAVGAVTGDRKLVTCPACKGVAADLLDGSDGWRRRG